MKQHRILSGLLALCLLLTLLPAGAAAEGAATGPAVELTQEPEVAAPEADAEEEQVMPLASVTVPEEGVSGQCGDSLFWSLTATGTLTVSGSGAMYDYTAETAPWYPYTSAGYVRELVLSDDITHIGDFAFYGGIGCPYYLGPVTDWTWSLELPSSLKTVGDSAFRGAKYIRELVISEGIDHIDRYAFAGICRSAYTRTETGYSNEDITGTLTMPGTWPTLEEGAFCDNRFTGALQIPEGVTDIPAFAFSNDRFSQLTLPESIRSIGDSAFAGLSVTQLELPARQPTMGKYVFSGCSQVTTLTVPESWTTIPEGMCRYWYALTSVTLPAGLKEIRDDAFQYCQKLPSISLPAGLERIGEYAFGYCLKLTEVTLPAGLTYLGSSAFRNTGLTAQPDWPAGIREVGNDVYTSCKSMTGTGTFPSGIGYTGTGLFELSGITSAVLADDMTVVPDRSLVGCSSLTRVYVPASVTAIHGIAFYNTYKLSHIYYEGAQADWDNIAYVDVPYGNSSSSKTRIETLIAKNGLHCLDTRRPETTVEEPVYTGTTAKRLIRVMVPGSTSYPQPGNFTVTAGETTASTGSGNYVTVELDKTSPGAVTVSGTGYHSYTLPEELVGSTANVISLYPTSRKGPFAQAILLDKSSGSYKSFANLLFESAVFYLGGDAGSSRSLYVDVNWNGCQAGTISLWQSNGKELPLQQGYNTGLNLSGGFELGQPIYLSMVTADGQQYTQELKLSVMQAATYYSVQLGTAVTEADIPELDPNTNENVDIFGGQKLSLDFKKLLGGKLPVSMEVGTDGTVKGTIGIKMGKTGAKGASFDTVKDAIDALHTSDASVIPGSTDLSRLLEQNAKEGNLPDATVVSVGVSGEMRLLGYIEGFYDYTTGKLELSQIGLGVAFKGSASYTQSYLVGGTPMYLTASVKGALEQAMNAYQAENSSTLIPGKETMKVSFGITLENGVGYPDVLTLGISGSGSLTVVEELPHTDSSTGTWTLSASAAVTASAVGFSTTTTIWNSDKLVLYQDGQILPSSTGTAALSMLALAEQEWSKVSQSYRSQPSYFAANDQVALLSDTGSDAAVGSEFQTGVYPYAEPLLVGNCALWLNAGAGSTTALYYSVYQNGTWSTPAPVDSANTTGSDYSPTAWADASGNVFLAWCRTDGGDSLAEAAAGMDICVSCIPVGSSAPVATRVFAVEGADMLPALGVADGRLRVAWVNSPDGIFATGGQQLYTADGTLTSDGITWDAPVLAASGLGGVDGLAVDASGDIWLTQASGSSRALYRVSGDTPMLVQKNASKPSLHGGVIWYYNTANGTVDSVAGDSYPAVAGSDWYRWLENADTLVVHGHDEDGSSVLYASYQGAALTELTRFTGSVAGIGAAESADGGIRLLVAHLTGEEDGSDLVLYQITDGLRAAFTGLTYDPATLIPGGTLSVSVEVENRGSGDIRYFRIQSGTEELYAASALACGESGTLSFDLPLADTLTENIFLTITPGGVAEDGEAVSLTLPLRLADVSLEEMYVQSGAEGGAAITLRVVNRGQTTLNDIAVSLHADTVDGAAAAESQTVATLDPGDVATLTFTAAAESIGRTGVFYAVAELPEGTAENFRANNIAFARLAAEQVRDTCSVYTSAHRAADGVQVTVSVENHSEADYTGTVYAAVYRNGQMVSVASSDRQTVQAGAMGSVLRCTLPVPDGDLEVKIFVLDSDGCPMRDAVTISLPQ